MHGLLSLWTRTPRFRPTRESLIVSTYAVCCGFKSFNTLELVTDCLGFAIAKEVGWSKMIDSIRTDLQELGGRNTRHIWALGKLYAILIQKGPFCHFDFDAFIRKPLPRTLMEAPIFAQSIDYPGYYSSPDISVGLQVLGFPPNHIAYNAGIIGGSDLTSLQDYAQRAISMAPVLGTCGIDGTAASMVIEQYYLGLYAHSRRIRIQTLLPTRPTEADAARYSYTHLQGETKYQHEYVSKVQVSLANEFPEAWEMLQKGWRKLFASGIATQ